MKKKNIEKCALYTSISIYTETKTIAHIACECACCCAHGKFIAAHKKYRDHDYCAREHFHIIKSRRSYYFACGWYMNMMSSKRRKITYSKLWRYNNNNSRHTHTHTYFNYAAKVYYILIHFVRVCNAYNNNKQKVLKEQL